MSRKFQSVPFFFFLFFTFSQQILSQPHKFWIGSNTREGKFQNGSFENPFTDLNMFLRDFSNFNKQAKIKLLMKREKNPQIIFITQYLRLDKISLEFRYKNN